MKTTVNSRIKQLRTSYKLTQSEFAEWVGVTSTQLSRIENEQSEPQNKTIKQIIAATGVNEMWMLHGEGELPNASRPQIVVTKQGDNIYQDALYKELKENASTWKQKYDELFSMFKQVLDRGGNLGKSKAPESNAWMLQTKSNVHSGVRAN